MVSTSTGRIRARLKGSFLWGGPVALAPDGRLLAALTDSHEDVAIHETATGRAIANIHTDRVQCLVLSPDNRTLVTTGEGGLRVWDLAAGKERLPHASRLTRPDETRPICENAILSPDGRRIIANVVDGTGLVWDLDAFERESLGPVPDASMQAKWWADLAGADAHAAYAAVWRLSENQSEALTLLRPRLKPATPPDGNAVNRWIDELGSDEYAVREAATARLRALGAAASPELNRAANSSTSPEVRKRAGELLARIVDAIPTGEALRSVRAIAVLERIGTDEARKLLEKMAAGAAGASETNEAKAALERVRNAKRRVRSER